MIREVRGTVEAIERELMPAGLVLRYDTSKVTDGLPPGEGVFLACSFWMVSSLKAIGRLDDARVLFERLLALRNRPWPSLRGYDIGRQRLVEISRKPYRILHWLMQPLTSKMEREYVIERIARGISSASETRMRGINLTPLWRGHRLQIAHRLECRIAAHLALPTFACRVEWQAGQCIGSRHAPC